MSKKIIILIKNKYKYKKIKIKKTAINQMIRI